MRCLWRDLLIMLKDRLEVMENGLASVAEELIPFIVLPDIRTVAHRLVPQIEQA